MPRRHIHVYLVQPGRDEKTIKNHSFLTPGTVVVFETSPVLRSASAFLLCQPDLLFMSATSTVSFLVGDLRWNTLSSWGLRTCQVPGDLFSWKNTPHSM